MQIYGTPVSREELRTWETEYRRTHGKLRARDLANQLDVPEAALLEASVGGTEGVISAKRLAANYADDEHFRGLVGQLTDVGEVMALTRNEACVHEKHGVYSRPEFYGAMGQIVGEIDLRLFTQHWAFGYSVAETLDNGQLRRSLQFFDRAGTAIHKVYATGTTQLQAFDRLASAATEPAPNETVFEKPEPTAPPLDDAEIDVTGFRSAWARLEHSHDFYGLLREFSVQRLQAMHLADTEFVRPIPPAALEPLLRRCAEAPIPIMVFVGNMGCVQIHSGAVHRIELMGPWLNVLDPRFNLHLRTDKVEHAFVVRKPSMRGDVHSVELYTQTGDLIAQIFGERKPGETERIDWRSTVQQI